MYKYCDNFEKFPLIETQHIRKRKNGLGITEVTSLFCVFDDFVIAFKESMFGCLRSELTELKVFRVCLFRFTCFKQAIY